MEYNNLLEIEKELRQYAKLEGTEFGEYCNFLCDLLCRIDCMSDNFRKEFEKELNNQLEFFKKETKIIEEEWQPPSKIIRKLEWINY